MKSMLNYQTREDSYRNQPVTMWNYIFELERQIINIHTIYRIITIATILNSISLIITHIIK